MHVLIIVGARAASSNYRGKHNWCGAKTLESSRFPSCASRDPLIASIKKHATAFYSLNDLPTDQPVKSPKKGKEKRGERKKRAQRITGKKEEDRSPRPVRAINTIFLTVISTARPGKNVKKSSCVSRWRTSKGRKKGGEKEMRKGRRNPCTRATGSNNRDSTLINSSRKTRVPSRIERWRTVVGLPPRTSSSRSSRRLAVIHDGREGTIQRRRD